MDRSTMLYIKWIINKDQLVQRRGGTLLNVMRQPGWKGSLGKNRYMCVYTWVSLLVVYLKLP